MLFLSLILQVVLFNFSKIDARYLDRDFNASFDQDLERDPYIVGGVDATIEELPYQVALLFPDGRQFCGGSIITPNVILTAAHCVYRMDPALIIIRAGSSYSNKGGEIVKLAQIRIHPRYNHAKLDYDVAVLLLEKNLPLGPTIKPIELQSVNEVVPDGTTAVISGWGRRKSDMSQLQKAEIRKANFHFCKMAYQLLLQADVTVRMTCYGLKEGGKGACHGDSGGALVVNGKQAGIVSWGAGCALAEVPGVYTDISNAEIQNYIFSAA